MVKFKHLDVWGRAVEHSCILLTFKINASQKFNCGINQLDLYILLFVEDLCSLRIVDILTSWFFLLLNTENYDPKS